MTEQERQEQIRAEIRAEIKAENAKRIQEEYWQMEYDYHKLLCICGEHNCPDGYSHMTRGA